jgi:predicted metalloprotease
MRAWETSEELRAFPGAVDPWHMKCFAEVAHAASIHPEVSRTTKKPIMRFTPGDGSKDVIDKRGERGSGGSGLGGAMSLLPLLLRFKYGWVVLLGIVAFSYFNGALGGGNSGSPHSAVGSANSANGPADTAAQFVGFVLDDVQKTWDSELARTGTPYRHAKLVLFTDTTRTACGYGEAATGPFYCPNDERVYIDLGFFDELSRKLGAQGDFAQAYVIAHEIGHHVQKILGISDRVQAAPRGAVRGASGLSVRLELQADCLAGVWSHFSEQRNLLEAGDLEEALNAAGAIGDDRLQRQSTGTVNPESFTHGSSAQRAAWFRRGHDGGTVQGCDTFGKSAP